LVFASSKKSLIYISNLKIIIKPLNDEEQGRKVVIQKIIIICNGYGFIDQMTFFTEKGVV